jgi:hypothetical protein
MSYQQRQRVRKLINGYRGVVRAREGRMFGSVNRRMDQSSKSWNMPHFGAFTP